MEPQCSPKSRPARAVEGAVLGAVVGIVGGTIMGAALRFTSKEKTRAPLFVALGIFGIAIVGQSIASAAPPEC